ncbi:hypothetical protein [Mycobacterium gordonae]|uniref:hypothetical protein n=1 Tax=Mycobacterium gordonae TaxID=1778 RepID=UPI001C4A37E9|nr:hypothetical protein [Mycobacterium gordonae]MCV7008662.1 hypothetical protein [Mycobacterium gordonae]
MARSMVVIPNQAADPPEPPPTVETWLTGGILGADTPAIAHPYVRQANRHLSQCFIDRQALDHAGQHP